MWIKRFTALLSCLVMPGLILVSSAQKVFASGGVDFSGAPSESALEGTHPVGHVGVRLPYTDLFTLQASAGYGEYVSLEGALQFHPLRRISGVQPYVFVGFGRYVSGSDRDERSVVPIGIGAEVPLTQKIGLNLELGGRWAMAINDPPTSLDVYPGLAPTIGVSYDLGGSNLPGTGGEETERPPVVAQGPEEAPAKEAPATGDDRTGGFTAAGKPRYARPQEGTHKVSVPGPARKAPKMRGESARMERPETTVVLDTTDGGEMMELPAGTFVMGLTDEDPLALQQAGRKRVSVTPFMLDKFEVSNKEYRTFLQEITPSRRDEMTPDSTVWKQARSRSTWGSYFRDSEFDDYPVIGVTYKQARGYCQFHDKRLPTEAEWEYAARGDLVGSIYPWPGYEPRNTNGRYLANYNPEIGGYAADGYAFTAPGDAYPPSTWGLYNMSGNVAEWVQDNYHTSYSDISDFNPLYEDPDEDRRIVRGGSWASNAFYVGVGVRDSQPEDKASPYIGFRCAANPGSGSEDTKSVPVGGTGSDMRPESDTESGSGN